MTAMLAIRLTCLLYTTLKFQHDEFASCISAMTTAQPLQVQHLLVSCAECVKVLVDRGITWVRHLLMYAEQRPGLRFIG